MNTPKWIEDKAENYLKENIDIEYNEGVCSTTDVGDAYIIGAMEVYQELDKWKEIAGDMYNWFKDAYGQEISTSRTGELIAKYEKLRDNAI